jgi:hypothetical protein
VRHLRRAGSAPQRSVSGSQPAPEPRAPCCPRIARLGREMPADLLSDFAGLRLDRRSPEPRALLCENALLRPRRTRRWTADDGAGCAAGEERVGGPPCLLSPPFPTVQASLGPVVLAGSVGNSCLGESAAGDDAAFVGFGSAVPGAQGTEGSRRRGVGLPPSSDGLSEGRADCGAEKRRQRRGCSLAGVGALG